MGKIINVSVRNKIAVSAEDALYVCGNSDFVIEFDFDEDWDRQTVKTARFNYGGEREEIVFSGTTCPVPVISNATHFYVGVYAGDLQTTTPAYVSARKSILCGGLLPPPPEPDVYTQIMELLNSMGTGVTQEQIAQAVDAYMAKHPVEGVTPEELTKAVEDALQTAKESGEFDGPQGPAGKDGKSPSLGASEIEGGHRVSVRDASGYLVQTFDVMDGKDGKDGKDGEPGADGKDGETGPAGADGKDYVLTDADKQEIAGMIPGGGGSVTDEQVQTAVNNYLTENPVSGALTANEKTLILALFKSAEYTSNVKAVVAQLEAIWTGSSTITYNVANNLTHVFTDNEASTTAGGMAYTATLTADEGYTLSEVTVTMDGEDVTADVYAEGVINIASVLGDIVITATAAEKVSLEPVYALSEPLVFDGSTMKEIDTGYSFYRSDGADMSFSVCVDFQNIANMSSLFWTGTDETDYMPTSLIGITKTSYWINMFVLGKTPGNYWNDGSKRYRVIMSHEADSADAVLHVWVEGESEYKTYTITSVTKKITSQNVNVILGGFFTNNQNYQTATMYDFKIYERVLSADEISAFMGV